MGNVLAIISASNTHTHTQCQLNAHQCIVTHHMGMRATARLDMFPIVGGGCFCWE